jgi:hypothetical protein
MEKVELSIFMQILDILWFQLSIFLLNTSKLSVDCVRTFNKFWEFLSDI